MTYVIAEPCNGVKNATCVDVCPVQCIHSTPDSGQYFIDPEVCIECEQCAVVCPVSAIFLDKELPEKWNSFIEINAGFFAENKVTAPDLDLATGARMAQAALDKASELGAAIALVIVDTAGEPVIERGMAGVPPSAKGEALAKSRALVGSLVGTRDGDVGQRRPSGGLSTPIGGEVPNPPGSAAIFAGIEVVGAISVVGGTESQNMLCARAAQAAQELPTH